MKKSSLTPAATTRRAAGPARIRASSKPSPRVCSAKAPRNLDADIGSSDAHGRLLEELAVLRKQAQRFDGAMPTVRLDPVLVKPSRWNHRVDSAFDSAAFRKLKDSIAATMGNTQPIVVRKADGGQYEIVFGHRRHRACLELGLPVLAVIWDREMTAHEHFHALDAENREREDPSCYEQGKLYSAALREGLFSSQRRLGEAIGVTHTWIGKALSVAALPPEVVKAFADPRKIQPVHADAVKKALLMDEGGVMARAAGLTADADASAHGVAQVVNKLVGAPSERTARKPIVRERPRLGHWHRESNGRVIITLPAELASDEAMQQLAPLIALALGYRGGLAT